MRSRLAVRTLLGLKAATLMETVLQQVIEEGSNVRQTEALVKRLQDACNGPGCRTRRRTTRRRPAP